MEVKGCPIVGGVDDAELVKVDLLEEFDEESAKGAGADDLIGTETPSDFEKLIKCGVIKGEGAPRMG